VRSIYAILLLSAFALTSCQKKAPYFSGGNSFEVETLAPEGIKVVGKLWYHNTTSENGDHMAENLKAYIGDNEPVPVNYGRPHVIKVGGGARYDVPVVFYVPADYVTSSVEEGTRLANKNINVEIPFQLKGTGTILVGTDRYDMPVDYTGTVKVWKDMPL
jgi:hypothetical protein